MEPTFVLAHAPWPCRACGLRSGGVARRNPDTIAKLPGVTAKKGDVFDKPGLVQGPRRRDQRSSFHRERSEAPDRGGQRGGRETLFRRRRGRQSRGRAWGKANRHAQFPAAYKAEATKGAEFLELLRKDKELDWTFLSPCAVIAPGERTGKFRLGKDQLLTHEKGSNISWKTIRSPRSMNSRSRRTSGGGSPSGIDARGGAGRAPCPPRLNPPRPWLKSGDRGPTNDRATNRAPAPVSLINCSRLLGLLLESAFRRDLRI